MKKTGAALALTAVLGLGGILGYGYVSEKDSSSQTTEVQSGSEVAEAPTERTVEGINANGYPWEYLGREKIKAEQDAGEVVFLFSDAEVLESELIEFTNLKDDNPGVTKEKVAESWAGHIGLFVSEVEPYYPDKKAYFDKLKEIESELTNGNYEAIPQKIEEARVLRAG
jgi:hypothetical protein